MRLVPTEQENKQAVSEEKAVALVPRLMDVNNVARNPYCREGERAVVAHRHDMCEERLAVAGVFVERADDLARTEQSGLQMRRRTPGQMQTERLQGFRQRLYSSASYRCVHGFQRGRVLCLLSIWRHLTWKRLLLWRMEAAENRRTSL